MATDGRRADPPLDELLFAEDGSFRFEFHQAVKLLEMLAPDATPVAEGSEPSVEPVRFRSRVGLDFPASEIDLLSRPKEGEPAAMVVNFLGLAGVLGPLPLPITERVIEQTWHHDTALRDFLDLFNHRLVSILARARKRYRPALTWKPPDEGPFARTGFALLGLGTSGLAGRMAVPDRALLSYAGLLVQQPRSQIGLEILLAHYFEVTIAVRPFAGRWLTLDPEEQTALGRSGRNQVLGGPAGSAVLGGRIWDQESGFELRLGPLHLHQFLAFLPIGRAFGALVDLVRFYAGNDLDFTVRLTLRAGEVPPCRLGWGPRLGWSSWLKTQHFEKDDSQVAVRGKR
ncbi:MAG TPA: type VI secretion system baseplate subunit TssG [Thermoanaerobaculia bacterium]|nr:type VI secretion system baseplate subunit TssG [Thermoanaerobaculia bacterium]